MKRALGVLAVLLLGMCLAGVVLACTILRPRTEILPPSFEEGDTAGDIALRSRIQFTHRWSLSPPWEWHFGQNGFAGCGPFGQTLRDGWQYGPFAYEEERRRDSWPVAVEKAARAMAWQKLQTKEPLLDFQINHSFTLLSWHVIASASGRKRLEMDLDEHGKPVASKKSGQ
ncbi:MAG: hypothetical protein QM758_05930 [Armatimonas sp.]